MSGPQERFVDVNGTSFRVWEKGSGEPICYLAGVLGLSQWTPFLDALSETRRVVVPSLPGFPGAEGHNELDTVCDWICATLDLLDEAGLNDCDVIGASLGGALAAEVAAMSPGRFRRLALVAPLGLHDDDAPIGNFWGLPPKQIEQVVAENRAEVDRQMACPDGVDEIEWSIITRRSITAGARLFWPMADVGLSKRLHRIKVPTCVVWGAEDQVIPQVYGQKFSAAIPGAVGTHVVPGAGHLADWDAPEAISGILGEFFA